MPSSHKNDANDITVDGPGSRAFDLGNQLSTTLIADPCARLKEISQT